MSDGADASGRRARPPLRPGLDALLSGRGTGLLTRLSAGPRSDPTGVSVWEGGVAPGGPGHVVLAIGIDPASATARRLLPAAARAGAVAVVLAATSGRCTADLAAAADEAGVALYERSTSASWLETLDAVRNAVAIPGNLDGGPTSDVSPGDLTSLSDVLADMLGGPVIIEDPHFRVLAYSSFVGKVDHGRDQAIIARQIPNAWLAHLERSGGLHTVLTTSDVVDLSDGPWQARRRLITAIRSGPQLLGILWLAEGDTPLAPDVSAQMTVAARLAAPQLWQHGELHLRARGRRGLVLRGLLEGEPIPRPFAEDLGLLPAAGHVVLAARRADGAALGDRERDRLVESIALYCQAFRWQTAVTAIGDSAYALMALTPDQHDAATGPLPERLAASCRRTLGFPVHVAVSSIRNRLDRTETMRHEADQVLEVLTRKARTGRSTLSFRDARPEIVLARCAAFLRGEPELGFDKLDELRHHDQCTGSAYTATLALYLDRFGDSAATAAALGLHPSTVRYRLRRLYEICGIDVEDPDERLLCQLLLRDDHAT